MNCRHAASSRQAGAPRRRQGHVTCAAPHQGRRAGHMPLGPPGVRPCEYMTPKQGFLRGSAITCTHGQAALKSDCAGWSDFVTGQVHPGGTSTNMRHTPLLLLVSLKKVYVRHMLLAPP
jgi:hypothetical protein